MASNIYQKRVDYILGQSEAADYLQELRTEVEKLAKRANQRLRELEKQGINESSRAYQVTARKVYDGLPGYVETRAGNIAFDRSLKNKTIQELEGELSELQHFLDPGEVHTSTVRGYKKQLEKSYQGYLESMKMLDEKGNPKENATSFEAYQQMFYSEQNRAFGYQNVRAMQKVPGATLEIVEAAIKEAIADEATKKATLGVEYKKPGVENYIARVKEKVKEQKQSTKAKRQGRKSKMAKQSGKRSGKRRKK